MGMWRISKQLSAEELSAEELSAEELSAEEWALDAVVGNSGDQHGYSQCGQEAAHEQKDQPMPGVDAVREHAHKTERGEGKCGSQRRQERHQEQECKAQSSNPHTKHEPRPITRHPRLQEE